LSHGCQFQNPRIARSRAVLPGTGRAKRYAGRPDSAQDPCRELCRCGSVASRIRPAPLDMHSIDPAAPFAPDFKPRLSGNPYRLPPSPVKRLTDPSSNKLGGKHRGHLCLRAAIACVPIKEILGSVIDRRSIIACQLLERRRDSGRRHSRAAPGRAAPWRAVGADRAQGSGSPRGRRPAGAAYPKPSA
jgi:hypothetical protein